MVSLKVGYLENSCKTWLILIEQLAKVQQEFLLQWHFCLQASQAE